MENMFNGSCNFEPVSASALLSRAGTEGVCRSLFGPSDPTFTKHLLQKSIKEESETMRTKYNFDITTETPLEGKFIWEKTSMADVPNFYARIAVKPYQKGCELRTLAKDAMAVTVTSHSNMASVAVSTVNSATPVSDIRSTSCNPVLESAKPSETVASSDYNVNTPEHNTQGSNGTQEKSVASQMETNVTSCCSHTSSSSLSVRKRRQTEITDFFVAKKTDFDSKRKLEF